MTEVTELGCVYRFLKKKNHFEVIDEALNLKSTFTQQLWNIRNITSLNPKQGFNAFNDFFSSSQLKFIMFSNIFDSMLKPTCFFLFFFNLSVASAPG